MKGHVVRTQGVLVIHDSLLKNASLTRRDCVQAKYIELACKLQADFLLLIPHPKIDILASMVLCKCSSY